MKGNKSVALTSPAEAQDGGRWDGCNRGLNQNGKLNCHSSPHLYLSIMHQLGKKLCVSVFVQFPPSIFQEHTQQPLPISSRSSTFLIIRCFVSHRSKEQHCNLVPFCLLRDEAVCFVSLSQVPRLCAKRAPSK